MRVKTEAKRQTILEAAWDLFREKGFEATTMSEIAARAGGSKATVYGYFDSKEALFIEIMMWGARDMREAFHEVTHQHDFIGGLRRLARVYVAFLFEPGIAEFRRIVIADGGRSGVGKLYYERGPKECLTMIAEFFAQAMDDGRMRRADPWTAATQIHALCESGLFQQRLLGVIDAASERQIRQAADAAIDVFLRAYAIEEPAVGHTREAVPA